MPHIELNPVRTHYQQSGSGPDVILIHAFTSNLAVWMLTGIVEKLSQDYRVTLYDLRGHGLSSVEPSGYTSSDLVNDLKQLHEELKLEPSFIVGHSFGGAIGMHAAALYPDMVRGIVLSDTYFPGLRDLEPDMGQSGPWHELRENFLKLDIDLGESVDFARLFKQVDGLTSEQMETLSGEMGAPGARWLSQMGQLARTTAGEEMFEMRDLTREVICGIEHPVVALYDEHSPFSATCDFLKSELRDCEVDIVPGAKHLAPVQNPKEFLRLVQHHLARICAS